jgi:flagellar biosynthesis/type III secretory pathway protein FliH
MEIDAQLPPATPFSFESLEPVAPVPARPAGASPADEVMTALAQAEAEAESLRASARAEGFAAGRDEALAAVAPALAALEEAATEVRAERMAAAQRLEAHAVQLALMLAEKVLAGAVAVQPEVVVEAVRGALRGIVERERVTVLVHPDDLEIVRSAMDELRGSLGGIEHCEVQAERRVSRGGAVVRTPDGDVDARVETKLVRAREVVEAALSAAGGVTSPNTGGAIPNGVRASEGSAAGVAGEN